MSEKSCFFIGHRYAPSSIKEPLTEAVEKHIVEYGVTTFTVGHYGWFDNFVMDVLQDAKKCYPHIKSYVLLPYYTLNQKFRAPEGFNGTIYPDECLEKVPKPFAIVRANRYMIEQSDYLITYCRNSGNTRNFVEYAKKREKKGLLKITLV